MLFINTALAAAGFALTANAHLFISSPMPIPNTAPKSPLLADGSNFPCHGVTLPSSGGEPMAAGSSQLLAFDTGNGANTAVHGGGSCQISITYETDAAAVKDPKNWFVIYSIESGCPTNSMMNLDEQFKGPQGTYTGSWPCTDTKKTNGVDCVNEFNFTIPEGVKSGHAIMAWTWFNNVGNRELYMNCINTQLTGGSGSEMSSFPSMFVANMADINTCATDESSNVKFPYPGKYVTTKLASAATTSYPIAVPSGAACASDGAPAGGNVAAPTNSSPDAPKPSTSAPAVSSPAGSAKASGSGVATITTIQTVSGAPSDATPSGAAPSGPASGSSAVASAAPSGATPSAAPSGVPSAAPSGSAPVPSGSTSSGACVSGSVSCSTPGAVVCIGSNQFGLCDINNCAVPQALAAGTHCTGGVVSKRSDHVRRHLGGRMRGQHV